MAEPPYLIEITNGLPNRRLRPALNYAVTSAARKCCVDGLPTRIVERVRGRFGDDALRDVLNATNFRWSTDEIVAAVRLGIIPNDRVDSLVRLGILPSASAGFTGNGLALGPCGPVLPSLCSRRDGTDLLVLPLTDPEAAISALDDALLAVADGADPKALSDVAGSVNRIHRPANDDAVPTTFFEIVGRIDRGALEAGSSKLDSVDELQSTAPDLAVIVHEALHARFSEQEPAIVDRPAG